MRRTFYALALVLTFSRAAQATQTITYSYDAAGRFGHCRPIRYWSNGIVVDYTHDKTDSGTNV